MDTYTTTHTPARTRTHTHTTNTHTDLHTHMCTCAHVHDHILTYIAYVPCRIHTRACKHTHTPMQTRIHQVDLEEPGFAIDLVKIDRQALRVYRQKGKHDDMAFERVRHNWAKYGAKKRLSKMKHLKLPKEIFQCCPQGSSRGVCGRACKCQQSARRPFFAQVVGRKSLRSALGFLSEQHNKVYRSRRGV